LAIAFPRNALRVWAHRDASRVHKALLVQCFSTISNRRRLRKFWGSFLICVCFLLLNVSAFAQGFGTMVGTKKKVVLHRKLPAIVHLTSDSFNVRVTARDKEQADVAQSLSDILETELLRDNNRLHVDKNAPGVTISCSITHFEIPKAQSFTRNELVLQKGHNLEQPKKFYKMSGTLEVAYQAKDRSGKVLDSGNLQAKYSKEYEEGTNQAADKSLATKVIDPVKRAAGRKTADSGPPTTTDIRQDLIHQVVKQVAVSLVNTDENVEVYLARGKLSNADKIAESGLWTRYLEELETMAPLSNSKDDAYRLYNIGVANEALAYQSEDHAAARKFIQQAAINYGKAIDGKPDENYFLEPQKRIESAAAYYKRLEDRREGVSLASSTDSTDSSANSASHGGSAKSTHTASSKKANTTTKSSTQAPPVTNASIKQKETAGKPTLTNGKVIEMFKSGVDEDNIIATIRQSSNVQFDISPDGQIELAKNGVKGKILAAMRERANRARSSNQ
jgi:hypothetical protein